MTDEQKEAIEYIKGQLENNYIDITNTYPEELEFNIVKEAITLYEQKEEIEKKDRQLEIKNRYLELIYDLGFDYDGWNEVDSLKALIDELVGYAKKAFNNDDKSVVYSTLGEGETFNILYEKVERIEKENNI